MSTTVTITGNLGKDPVIRFTQSGKPVVAFSVGTSKRTKNEQTGEWTSTEETWWDVTAWDTMAENVAETLAKGDAVVVVGRAYTEKYTKQDGTPGQSLKVQAYHVGVDLKKNSAAINRVSRASAASERRDSWGATPPADDPWTTPATDMPF